MVIDATNGKDALKIVDKESIDLILLDIMMPEMDGYEVCRVLHSKDKTKDIPIIFITAKSDEDSIEMAYDVGGSDYITKPFRPKELLSRVKKELKMQELISELKLLASTDPMTKLYNRRHFNNMVESVFELHKREGDSLAILMLDIDKFKNVNDTYGHKVGDEVIIALADELRSSQRKSDIICRYGGEEFVVVLPKSSLEGIKIVAEKLRLSISSLEIDLKNAKKLKFTVSIGVSCVDFEKESTIEQALKRADNALYVAKDSGRNRVCLSI